jgi:hypothetical protein
VSIESSFPLHQKVMNSRSVFIASDLRRNRNIDRCTACKEKNNQEKWNGELHARIVKVEYYSILHDSLINYYGL